MAESAAAAAADPFQTAELRRRVLAAWADAPARFREDANAEEDFALGGYRDRVVVELAQNAADAARRSGVPGHLFLELSEDRLTAANTGAPLTTEGVESLSTLRASSKRGDEGSAGRFGVGFSAVSALSDDVTVASSAGAVRFSGAQAGAAVADLLAADGTHEDLALEVQRRSGHVPMLRLPFPADEVPVPDGYDTAVTLVLRDEDSAQRVRELLDRTGEALLLALDGLAEVRVRVDGAEHVLTREEGGAADADLTTTNSGAHGDRTTAWRLLSRSGRFSQEVLSDRPAEERERTEWRLTWAVPIDSEGRVAPMPSDVEPVVHAPTPTDTALDLPAVLLGTFPLSTDRRGVQSGAVTDLLLTEAANAYCALLRRFGGRAALDLVPGTKLGGGPVDSVFRTRVAEPLRDTTFLVTEAGLPVAPRDAVLLDSGGGADGLAGLLSELIPQVLPGVWNPRHPALVALKVRRLGLADLADLLSDTDRAPAWWAELYATLATADTTDLGALPVPLVDGRLVRGPRALLMPTGDWRPTDSEALGVRVVHPEAAHPLLLRLGAVEATAATVLADPRTEAAVRDSLDAEEPDPIAEAVLDLVASSGTGADELSWLSELALRDDEDGYSVAGELLVPGAPLADVLADDAPFGTVHQDLIDRHGADVLRAVGALWGFGLVRAEEVALGEDVTDDFDGDGIEDWADAVLERVGDPELPPVVPELVCVADLDCVAEDRWPQALAMLAEGPLREAVTAPARVLLPDGRVEDVPSYTAWWLRSRARLAGRAPVELRAGDAEPALTGLYDEAPATVDREFARALGVRTSVAELLADPDGPDDLLTRMADPALHVGRTTLHSLWTAVAATDPSLVSPPTRVRAVREGTIVVADAEDTLVLDSPDLLPLLDAPLVIAPAALAEQLADVLDLDLASEAVTGRVTSAGSIRQVPDEAELFLGTADRTYLHHQTLTVDGTETEWFIGDDGVHASTTDGLARGLCWRAGAWSRRHLLAAALRDPAVAARLLAEADLD
ncbi:sacsin N-terminal ATP-binding-like domain-containing protein [Nocardiopsis salina]|uniref:sacsin N-terminal ATP-binding-like domain-containing protein n=1 Tax=Nocardiopsis salina TaxID=245836 RepID=UPI000344AEDD|nr:ATP-binding protein [Nocardiopsis salina]